MTPTNITVSSIHTVYLPNTAIRPDYVMKFVSHSIYKLEVEASAYSITLPQYGTSISIHHNSGLHSHCSFYGIHQMDVWYDITNHPQGTALDCILQWVNHLLGPKTRPWPVQCVYRTAAILLVCRTSLRRSAVNRNKKGLGRRTRRTLTLWPAWAQWTGWLKAGGGGVGEGNGVVERSRKGMITDKKVK